MGLRLKVLMILKVGEECICGWGVDGVGWVSGSGGAGCRCR